MIKDIPYDTLKSQPRNYEILLLRDQYDNTYTDIAKEFEITVNRVIQIYHRLKMKQIDLYITHLSVVSGYQDTEQFKELYNAVYHCYYDYAYVTAYFENKYKDILDGFRAGEPGMPQHFIEGMPPFKAELDKEAIERVIEMREVEKKSYIEIGEELEITRFKARGVYERFYYKMLVEYVNILEERTDNVREKFALWNNYFKNNISSKKQYELLIRDHPELLSINDSSGQFDPK